VFVDLESDFLLWY